MSGSCYAVPAGMPAHSLHTRGATLIATTCCFALSSRQRDGGWDVTTFSRFFRCMGTTHPCLLTSAGKPAEIFFGWPLTKAFGEGRSIPNFHSVSDRCRRPHPVLCSLNAGQSALNLCFKDTSRPAKSQSVAKKRGAESPVSLRALPLVRALFPQRDTHGGLQRLESSPLEIIPFTLRVTMGA